MVAATTLAKEMVAMAAMAATITITTSKRGDSINNNDISLSGSVSSCATFASSPSHYSNAIATRVTRYRDSFEELRSI